jgi:hypothetical protein
MQINWSVDHYLTVDQKAYFEFNLNKNFRMLKNPSKNIASSIITTLKLDSDEKKVVLDNDECNIHFKNGYWSFNDELFHTREQLHYVSHHIDFDLKINFTRDAYDDVEAWLSQSFPDVEAFRFFVREICMSLKRIPTQHFLILLGNGANGKTFFMNVLKSVFQRYFVSLPSSTLNTVSSMSKAMVQIKHDTVISFIDEIDTNVKKQSMMLKKLADGEVQYNKLYKDGVFTMESSAKLVINSNHILSFNEEDGGINRRLLYIKFDKIFTNSHSTTYGGRLFENLLDLKYMSIEQKSLVFMYFAYVSKFGDIVNTPIPKSISSFLGRIDFKSFVSHHFKYQPNAQLTTQYVVDLFNSLGDKIMDYKDIINNVLKQYPPKSVSLQKINLNGVSTIVIKNITTIADNVRYTRDLDYEAQVMKDDSCKKAKMSHVQLKLPDNLDLTEIYVGSSSEFDDLMGEFENAKL